MQNPNETENSIYKNKAEKDPGPYKPKPKTIFKGLVRKTIRKR
jgi:hypothetical protein